MASTSNLPKLKCPVVYSATTTRLNALVGHRCSFVFPYALRDSEIPETTILCGTIREIIFTAGSTVENIKSIGKTNRITPHGAEYPLPDEILDAHEQGVAAAHRCNKVKTQILGTRSNPPRTLEVSEYVVELDVNQHFPETEQNTTNLELVTKIVGLITLRHLNVSMGQKAVQINVPVDWFLQNLTALDHLLFKQKPAPVIEIPVAFPLYGSKISTDGGIQGTIVDFGITSDERVEILFSSVEGGLIHKMIYSKVYAMKSSDLRSPHITRMITVHEYNRLPTTHVKITRDYIRKYLSLWKPVVVMNAEKEMRMLCSVGDGKSARNVWKTPSEAFEEDGPNTKVNFVSMVDCTFDEEDGQERKLKSCVSNAVIGTVRVVSNGKPVNAFFSTENARGMALTTDPIFKPFELTQSATIDMLNPPRMLGYITKSDRKDKDGQEIVNWTPVSDAFYNFYVWVDTQTTAKIFNGKTVSELKAMFHDENVPEIVEIYEFMAFGMQERMLNKEQYPWVHWFATEILMASPKDLLANKE